MPVGEFDRVKDVKTGNAVVVAGTWHKVEYDPAREGSERVLIPSFMFFFALKG